VPPQRASGDGDDPRPRRQDRDAQGGELSQRLAAREQARCRRAASFAGTKHRQRYLGLRPAPHAKREIPVRRGAHQQLDRRLPRRRRRRQPRLPRQHSHREAAARLCHRLHGTHHGRLRREIGNHHLVFDRPIERQPGAGRQGPDRQGLELGGDRQLRLITATDPIFRCSAQPAGKWRLSLFSLLAALTLLPGIAGAAYPERPITMTVAYPPGGGTDLVARALAPYLEKYLGGGAKIVIVNRAGAGGEVGFTAIANAAPDGYTIGFVNTPPLMTIPIERTAQFGGPQRFELLGNIIDDPCNFAVHSDLPIRDLKELAAYARANPEFQAQATKFFAPLRFLTPAQFEGEIRDAEAGFRQMWKELPWAEK